jgi:uncharacterized protein YdaU (DUF1376 family)
MTDTPYMKMYWADYLADTTHLTTEQHGAYMLLIAAYWRRQKPLPDDDEFLRNIVRFSRHVWKKTRPVLESFFEINDGKWTHKRLENELLSASVRIKAAAHAAKIRHSGNDAQDMPYHIQSQSINNNNNITTTARTREGQKSVIQITNQDEGKPASEEPKSESDAVKIIAAFDNAIGQVFGENRRRPWPHAKDFEIAKEMVAAGATAEIVEPLFVAGLTKRRNGDQDIPAVLSYFKIPVMAACESEQKHDPSVTVARMQKGRNQRETEDDLSRLEFLESIPSGARTGAERKEFASLSAKIGER